eukprot:CAMPEP_0196760446 /NCGR_PEP_ID=MMETSP1091-20130531/105222_1 /TAXON_ID=302021 /ORGANISM="Rhodomonas sp., Strain CCMP768" /LENGTH=135 /DNA_ID=CAMNT_0042109331 /DNA_START=915 /DNA_END=1322 /DNA_ORIENTATION=+
MSGSAAGGDSGVLQAVEEVHEAFHVEHLHNGDASDNGREALEQTHPLHLLLVEHLHNGDASDNGREALEQTHPLHLLLRSSFDYKKHLLVSAQPVQLVKNAGVALDHILICALGRCSLFFGYKPRIENALMPVSV